MTRLNIPDERDRDELSGRMIEAIDIEVAIRSGRFSSLDELADWLAEQSHLMSQARRCDTWVMDSDKTDCLDLSETLAYARPGRRSTV